MCLESLVMDQDATALRTTAKQIRHQAVLERQWTATEKEAAMKQLSLWKRELLRRMMRLLCKIYRETPKHENCRGESTKALI